MVTEIVMPRYDWSQVDGTVVKWLKSDKQTVNKGEVIAQVESMKAVFDIEAPETGTLSIYANEGTVVPVGEPIAYIAGPGEEVPSTPSKSSGVQEIEGPTAPAIHTKGPLEGPAVPRDLRISPTARRLAREHRIDITKLAGTGPDGRIVREDVMRAIEQIRITAASPIETLKVSRTILMAGTRKTIADRLSQSYRDAVHVTITIEADMTKMATLRQELIPEIKRRTGASLSYTECIVKAVAIALKENLIANSTLTNDQIRLYDDVNIGVAVAVDEGLVVPVVRNADKKSLEEIVVELETLIGKAKQRALSLEEMAGGTFTISNLGVFGIESFEPIINPPQSAIMGVGAVTEKPVVIDGQIAVRPIVNLSLVFDHRVLDGAQGAKFLQSVKRFLEDPKTLLA